MLPSRLKRFAVGPKALFSVSVLLGIVLWAVPTFAQESIDWNKDKEPAESTWFIKQPQVKVARKDYNKDNDKVLFRQYDEVIVTAGGCVQTGGTGKTWKRYVDPLGANSDRLYHGRIWIPGATDGLVRISSIVGLPLVINKFPQHTSPTPESDPYFLRLGYEDDNLDDNGYYPKEADNGSQCSLGADKMPIEGTAWIRIRAIHHTLADAPSSPDPRAPLDLWWGEVDDNFLPYNPDWWIHHHGIYNPKTGKDEIAIPNSKLGGCKGFQEVSKPNDFLPVGKSPQCTMWDPDVDEANLKSPFCHVDDPPLGKDQRMVHGHVNWGVVTYKGKIYFDVSNNFHPKHPILDPIGDGDYDWFLAPDDIDSGISEGNVADSQKAFDRRRSVPNGVHTLGLEFSSRETIDKIKNSNTWWETFHHDVDHDPVCARRSVNGKTAIAIGLMGFDNEHGFDTGARVELHPVYGLAIQVQTGPEEVWVIMARNWGNEGSCSNGWDITRSKWQHFLALHENKMKFFLPTDAGVSAVLVKNFHDKNGNVSEKSEATSLAGGVLLSFQLPEPETQGLVWGELHIRR